MSKNSLALAVALLLSALAVRMAQADTVYFVTTGHSGAQVQADVDHTQHWTYSVSANVSDVAGGLFDMKRGPKTSADIVFSIFQGTYADYDPAHPLLSVTLAPGSFTQQYENVAFQSTPITLHAGSIYTAVLRSPAADAQSHAYFIKGGCDDPLFLVDPNGNPLSKGGQITPPEPSRPSVAAPPVPLPSALYAGVAMLTGLGFWRANRRRQLDHHP